MNSPKKLKDSISGRALHTGNRPNAQEAYVSYRSPTKPAWGLLVLLGLLAIGMNAHAEYSVRIDEWRGGDTSCPDQTFNVILRHDPSGTEFGAWNTGFPLHQYGGGFWGPRKCRRTMSTSNDFMMTGGNRSLNTLARDAHHPLLNNAGAQIPAFGEVQFGNYTYVYLFPQLLVQIDFDSSNPLWYYERAPFIVFRCQGASCLKVYEDTTPYECYKVTGDWIGFSPPWTPPAMVNASFPGEWEDYRKRFEQYTLQQFSGTISGTTGTFGLRLDKAVYSGRRDSCAFCPQTWYTQFVCDDDTTGVYEVSGPACNGTSPSCDILEQQPARSTQNYQDSQNLPCTYPGATCPDASYACDARDPSPLGTTGQCVDSCLVNGCPANQECANLTGRFACHPYCENVIAQGGSVTIAQALSTVACNQSVRPNNCVWRAQTNIGLWNDATLGSNVGKPSLAGTSACVSEGCPSPDTVDCGLRLGTSCSGVGLKCSPTSSQPAYNLSGVALACNRLVQPLGGAGAGSTIDYFKCDYWCPLGQTPSCPAGLEQTTACGQIVLGTNCGTCSNRFGLSCANPSTTCARPSTGGTAQSYSTCTGNGEGCSCIPNSSVGDANLVSYAPWPGLNGPYYQYDFEVTSQTNWQDAGKLYSKLWRKKTGPGPTDMSHPTLSLQKLYSALTGAGPTTPLNASVQFTEWLPSNHDPRGPTPFRVERSIGGNPSGEQYALVSAQIDTLGTCSNQKSVYRTGDQNATVNSTGNTPIGWICQNNETCNDALSVYAFPVGHMLSGQLTTQAAGNVLQGFVCLDAPAPAGCPQGTSLFVGTVPNLNQGRLFTQAAASGQPNRAPAGYSCISTPGAAPPNRADFVLKVNSNQSDSCEISQRAPAGGFITGFTGQRAKPKVAYEWNYATALPANTFLDAAQFTNRLLAQIQTVDLERRLGHFTQSEQAKLFYVYLMEDGPASLDFRLDYDYAIQQGFFSTPTNYSDYRVFVTNPARMKFTFRDENGNLFSDQNAITQAGYYRVKIKTSELDFIYPDNTLEIELTAIPTTTPISPFYKMPVDGRVGLTARPGETVPDRNAYGIRLVAPSDAPKPALFGAALAGLYDLIRAKSAFGVTQVTGWNQTGEQPGLLMHINFATKNIVYQATNATPLGARVNIGVNNNYSTPWKLQFELRDTSNSDIRLADAEQYWIPKATSANSPTQPYCRWTSTPQLENMSIITCTHEPGTPCYTRPASANLPASTFVYSIAYTPKTGAYKLFANSQCVNTSDYANCAGPVVISPVMNTALQNGIVNLDYTGSIVVDSVGDLMNQLGQKHTCLVETGGGQTAGIYWNQTELLTHILTQSESDLQPNANNDLPGIGMLQANQCSVFSG